MAASFQRVFLSGSTNGRPIKIAATASPGDTVHTAVAGTVQIDEVYLYVTNTSGSIVAVTVEWGGVTNPDDRMAPAMSIPPNSGPILLIPGLPINNGLAIKVFAGTTAVLLVEGWVNRIG